MSILIAAIPLFDGTMTVKAYRLCDHSPDMALNTKDDFRGKQQEFELPSLEIIQKTGLEPFSGELPLLLDVSRFHVMTGLMGNRNIDPEKLVLTVSAGLEADEKLLNGLADLKGKKYSIALDGWPEGGLGNPLVMLADYMLLDFRGRDFFGKFGEAKKKRVAAQIIVTNLPDMATYNKYAGHKNTLFTGGFYNHPITTASEDLSPMKVNALRLIKQINAEDFELRNITEIVERDPSLSISLLRFINSPAVAMRSQVESISNAVALLGQKEIRRWATITISVDLSKDRPSEITKLSLMRAKFAENLAGLFEMGVFQGSLFMTGLFSLLDVILKKPMPEAIQEIAVDNLVLEALVERKGSLYKVLDFIYAYERADWNKVSVILIQNDIKGEAIGDAYMDALMWYHQLLDSLDEEEAAEAAAETA